MEYDERSYFAEEEYDDVKGFTVLSVDSDERRYHIAEKWLKDEGEDKWLDYWIPESDLLERVEDGACSLKGKLTDEQYQRVCELAGWRYDKQEVEI